MIISVVNQKGGCGKTTIATNLAASFALDGREVLLVDADPEQHSSMNWCADRPDNFPKVHASNLPARNLRKDADTLRKKWEIVIIDGGARVTEHAHVAVAVADWLVIPVKPSKVDLDATSQFLDIVQMDMSKRDDLSGGLILNQMQEGTAIGSAARAQLSEWNFPVFDSILRSYVAFAEAVWHGQSVNEYAPKSKASSDFVKFFKELKGAIKE